MTPVYPLFSAPMFRLALILLIACSDPAPPTTPIQPPDEVPVPPAVSLDGLEGGPRVLMGTVSLPDGHALELAGSANEESFVHIRSGQLDTFPAGTVLRIRQPVGLLAQGTTEVFVARVRPEQHPFPNEVTALALPEGRRVRSLNRDAHEQLPFAGGKLRVKIFFDGSEDGPTHGAFSLLDGDADLGVPEHVHEESAEVLFIESGDGTMILGEERFPLEPGRVVYVPPNVRHGYEPGTQPLRALQVYAPAGPEQRFRSPPHAGLPGATPLNQAPPASPTPTSP